MSYTYWILFFLFTFHSTNFISHKGCDRNLTSVFTMKILMYENRTYKRVRILFNMKNINVNPVLICIKAEKVINVVI